MNQQPHSLFKHLMELKGECVRAQHGRLTQRIQMNGKNYFIKQHTGVGWGEILKNLVQLRLPVVSAVNEWFAIGKLHQLKVPVPKIAAYSCKGINPARKKSFIITEELAPIISLEELTLTWKENPPPFKKKRILLKEVARIAAVLHNNGINHRDFYLCHFLLNTEIEISNNQCLLYLIDLHRAQIRKKTPNRWVIKDLASLFFSSKDIGLTKHDYLLFMKQYRALSLRQIITNEKDFWQKVISRGEQLYRNSK